MTRSGRNFDAIGAVLAVATHGGVLLWLALMPPTPPRRRTVVEVDIRKPPPPPPPTLTPPTPEPPKEPERKIVKKPDKPPTAPKANKPQQPVEPPKPVFGLDKSDLVGDGISVPEGNTTMANPAEPHKGPVAPLPPSAGVPAGKEWHPLSELDLRSQPEHDSDACFAGMKDKYSSSDAYAEGIEGEVVFRIELDDRGKVRSIKKVKGLGHGLDEMAMGWLRFNPKCKFSPAIGKDGKPGGYVIDPYKITFEIQR